MSGEDEVEMRMRAREEREAIVTKYDRGREEGAVIDDWEDPRLELYHVVDRYGFIHDERLPENYGRTEREQRIVEKELSRLDKWVSMVRDPRKYFPQGAKHRDTMVGRVWKGVPLRMRGEMWRILLDVDTLKKQHRGTYDRMKAVARKHSPDIRQIDLDVNRTYRNHTTFRERYNGKQQDLFHVLAAYSMYNTEVGYCQGMSQVAALLLMYLMSEEDAFWGLHKLMVGEKYRMHGFFIPNFPKLMRFQEHFDKLLLKKLYRLQKHLVKHEVVSGIYTLKWFFQCFLDRLPFSLTLRVWDLYLLEGEQIMFAMAYTILKMHRQRLMKMGMDDLLEFIQKTLESNFGYEDDVVIDALRQNLLELRSSRLHTAGDSPAIEQPTKPFGMERLQTAEEEAGYRLPFSNKEREYSLHTIQRENETQRKLQHINSQSSIDEGSFDHSLNDTVSVEPETEDHHSDLLEQDISIEISESPHNSNIGERSGSHTPSDRSHAPSDLSRGKYPILPPSPLPPSKEQDELDNTLITMLEQAGSLEALTPHTDMRTSQADMRTSQADMRTSHTDMRTSHTDTRTSHTDMRTSNTNIRTSHTDMRTSHADMRTSHADMRHSKLDTRPASADQYKLRYKDDRKRHSAHVPLTPSQLVVEPEFPHFVPTKAVLSPPRSPQGVVTDPDKRVSKRSPLGGVTSPDQRVSGRSPPGGSTSPEQRTYSWSPQQSSASKLSTSGVQDHSTGDSSILDASFQQSNRIPNPHQSGRRLSNAEPDHSAAGGDPHLRDGSRVRSTSRSSHGSRASRTYYFGENPMDLSNGVEDLNSSFEGATPHKGEVVRIRVPFDETVGGPGVCRTETGIHREDKEISPRYNGHKVTIQVNRSSTDDRQGASPTGFVSKHILSQQVTKKYISSTVRKINSSEEVHRTTHSMLLTQHSLNSNDTVPKSEVLGVDEYEERRMKDGRLVSHHQEFQQYSPQMVPVYRSTSPKAGSVRKTKNTRSSRSSASETVQPRETFF